MRQNLPVTDHETHVAEDQAVVSQTDLDGNIVYVNPDFCQASGHAAVHVTGRLAVLADRRPRRAAPDRGPQIGERLGRRARSLGLDQVNLAIEHMDEVTQQNAALVEQAATAADSLAGEAGHLTQAVSLFQFGRPPTMPGLAHVRAGAPIFH
jgi:hypothetical protein